MKREVVTIDENKCDGCGLCVPGCPEGALQVIDGKARLVSDLLCDGLGACIGECPKGAIKVEEKEAQPYEERKVIENIAKAGANTIKAHLKHLDEHGQKDFLNEAVAYLKEKNIAIPDYKEKHAHGFSGCPGSRVISYEKEEEIQQPSGAQPSALRQWPVQLHLVSPTAPYFNKADLLLAADCTAFSMGNFHRDYLKGRALAIACPKLDEGQDVYVEKLSAMIDESQLNTITVMIMQVPCCGGLAHMAKAAAANAKRKIPVKAIVVGLKGEILSEEWI